MQSWRNNPDSEACQAAERDNNRAIFAAIKSAQYGQPLANDTVNECLDRLEEALPDWHFARYGKGLAVACYPPGGPSLERWRELEQHQKIHAVCGPFYVVNLTLGEFLSMS